MGWDAMMLKERQSHFREGKLTFASESLTILSRRSTSFRLEAMCFKKEKPPEMTRILNFEPRG